MILPRTALLVLLATSAVGQSPPAVALQGRTFVEGDLGSLTCRVIASKPIDEASQLLTVEVQNQGAVAAEPLAFGIELVAKGRTTSETFERAQLPHVGRCGRAAPAGGKATYLVPTWLAPKKAPFTVRVTAASFVQGGDLPRPVLGFGKPEQVQRTSLVGTFPVTQFRLDNPLDCDLDVLLLVQWEQPRDLTDLIGVRLEAKASRDVLLVTRPGQRVFVEPNDTAPGCAMKATKFELVDWCAVGEPPVDAARAALRAAYEAWYRWPEAAPTASGDFVFTERRARPNAAGQFDDFRVSGRFTLTAAGGLQVATSEGSGANPQLLLGDTLANLRRPDFAALAAANRLVPVAVDRIAIVGPGWHGQRQDHAQHSAGGAARSTEFPDLQVAGDRIVSDGTGSDARAVWEMRMHGGATVVTRRKDQNTDCRFAYATVDGRVVPTTSSRVVQFGKEPYSVEELTLTNVRVGGDVQPAAPALPTGPGVEALRASWDASYRLPTAPIVVEAKFAVTTGNDGVWAGVGKLSGTIEMTGVGRNLVASDIRFDGNLTRSEQVQFAAVLRDRLGMWIARDFNDRAPFDEYFRGAVIAAPDAAGTFAIENGPIGAVLTSGGLVRGFRGRDGGTTAFTYARFGDRQAVTRVDQQIEQRPLGVTSGRAERWDAVMHVTLAPVGPHLLPTRIGFERTFGRDWTPETLVFRDLRLRER